MYLYLGEGDGGEVLDVIGEVHGVTEGGLQGVHYHVLVPLVGEPDQELGNLAGRQL